MKKGIFEFVHPASYQTEITASRIIFDDYLYRDGGVCARKTSREEKREKQTTLTSSRV